MTGPEAKVERYLRQQVSNQGGICIKLIPTVAGVPDRLVLLPGGLVRLVELKSPVGYLRPVQRVFRDRVAKLDIEVAVLRSKPEVDKWLSSML